jgi:4-coumarate--CoA ligase
MPDTNMSENDVKDFIKDRLAAYKQLRGGVRFVHDLPKNALGKILRRELRDRAGLEEKGERAKL